MISSLLKPSSFTIGCLTVLAAVCLFYSFGSGKPQLLASFDNRLIDLLFHLRGKSATSGEVVIVDIDDQSLARIGQWPWPRNMVADLVTAIRQAGARVTGFDIVFCRAGQNLAGQSSGQPHCPAGRPDCRGGKRAPAPRSGPGP